MHEMITLGFRNESPQRALMPRTQVADAKRSGERNWGILNRRWV